MGVRWAPTVPSKLGAVLQQHYMWFLGVVPMLVSFPSKLFSRLDPSVLEVCLQ